MQVRVFISARVPWISVVDLVVLVVFPLAFQRLGDFVGLESRNSETNTVFFGNLHGIMVISIGKISITMILPWYYHDITMILPWYYHDMNEW